VCEVELRKFTLIELLVIIAIIGILASLLPVIANACSKRQLTWLSIDFLGYPAQAMGDNFAQATTLFFAPW